MKVSSNFYLNLSAYIFQVTACVFREVTQSCHCWECQLLHGLPSPTLPVQSMQDSILGAPLHPWGWSTSLKGSPSTVSLFSAEDAKHFYWWCRKEDALHHSSRRASGDKVRGVRKLTWWWEITVKMNHSLLLLKIKQTALNTSSLKQRCGFAIERIDNRISSCIPLIKTGKF